MIKIILLQLAISAYDDFCTELLDEIKKYNITQENKEVCLMLIRDSLELKMPVKYVLGIAWEESRFTAQEKITKYKCVGPLQIKVKYWCEGKKLGSCDTFYDGVKAVKYYYEKFKPVNKFICYYNNSNKCNKSYLSNYTKSVIRTLKKIDKLKSKPKYSKLKLN